MKPESENRQNNLTDRAPETEEEPVQDCTPGLREESAVAKKRHGVFRLFPKKFSFRISTKVSMIFSMLFLILGVLSIVITVVVAEHSLNSRAKSDMKNTAVLVAEIARTGVDIESGLNEVKAYLAGANMKADVSDAETGIRWCSDDRLEPTAQDEFVLTGVVLRSTFSDQNITVTVAYDMSAVRNATTVNEITFVACIIVSLVLVILFGGLSAKAVTRPIRKMTDTTRLITKDALDTRLSTEDTQDELRELAEVINNMLDNLQVTIESQERFVSDASHEMRTPIAVIKGYASMLQRWGSTDQAILTESIDAIAKEANNMQGLIDNLLFLSRTDRDVLQVKFEPFALSEVVDETLRETEMTDEDHIYTAGRMEVTDVIASRDMVKQLLRIVTENAKKYTPKGGTIAFECYQENLFAVMSVRDQGIGIAKKDLDHVFERFYRADKARKRSGGSGLGMSIAKKIADVHGGEIILESKVGEGTIVTVYLPVKQEEKA